MATPLKYIYNEEFFNAFAPLLAEVLPDFSAENFTKDVFAGDWEELELKARMRRISTVLRDYQPKEYKKAVAKITALLPLIEERHPGRALEYMFLPDFIEQYGLSDVEISLRGMERITQYTSCEFAIRPYLLADPEVVMRQMTAWSTHPHHAVRRFASEGCRPRLPWAQALPQFKKDPAPILPILENLLHDESDFVRKSVANNLNDISKDHPQVVLAFSKKHQGKSKSVDWIIKHANRTLLKQGNPEALRLFGFGSTEKIEIEDFVLREDKIKIGESLEFSFTLKNTDTAPAKIRLEYGVYFMKANGSLARKVFQISERIFPAGSETKFVRKQPFKIITTRKLYPGEHRVALIVNGEEQEQTGFRLEGEG